MSDSNEIGLRVSAQLGDALAKLDQLGAKIDAVKEKSTKMGEGSQDFADGMETALTKLGAVALVGGAITATIGQWRERLQSSAELAERMAAALRKGGPVGAQGPTGIADRNAIMAGGGILGPEAALSASAAFRGSGGSGSLNANLQVLTQAGAAFRTGLDPNAFAASVGALTANGLDQGKAGNLVAELARRWGADAPENLTKLAPLLERLRGGTGNLPGLLLASADEKGGLGALDALATKRLRPGTDFGSFLNSGASKIRDRVQRTIIGRMREAYTAGPGSIAGNELEALDRAAMADPLQRAAMLEESQKAESDREKILGGEAANARNRLTGEARWKRTIGYGRVPMGIITGGMSELLTLPPSAEELTNLDPGMRDPRTQVAAARRFYRSRTSGGGPLGIGARTDLSDLDQDEQYILQQMQAGKGAGQFPMAPGMDEKLDRLIGLFMQVENNTRRTADKPTETPATKR